MPGSVHDTLRDARGQIRSEEVLAMPTQRPNARLVGLPALAALLLAVCFTQALSMAAGAAAHAEAPGIVEVEVRGLSGLRTKEQVVPGDWLPILPWPSRLHYT